MSPFKLSDLSLKVWMGIVAVLMAFAVFLTMTIANVAPQVVVLSQLFSPDVMNFNETIEATNMKAQVKEKLLIEEMLVRYYVESRNEYIPDKKELLFRWGVNGPVRRLSTPAIFRSFLAEKGNFVEKLEENNDAFAQESIPVTSVDITNVYRRDGENNFIVDFKLYQNKDGVIVGAGSRRAVIRIEPEDRSAIGFWEDFSNPYGVRIISYKETANN